MTDGIENTEIRIRDEDPDGHKDMVGRGADLAALGGDPSNGISALGSLTNISKSGLGMFETILKISGGSRLLQGGGDLISKVFPNANIEARFAAETGIEASTPVAGQDFSGPDIVRNQTADIGGFKPPTPTPDGPIG